MGVEPTPIVSQTTILPLYDHSKRKQWDLNPHSLASKASRLPSWRMLAKEEVGMEEFESPSTALEAVILTKLDDIPKM